MTVGWEDIEAYTAAHTTAEHPLLASVAAETKATQEAHGMMVGLVEGRFLETLVWVSAGSSRSARSPATPPSPWPPPCPTTVG